MLIHPWDSSVSEDEWREWVERSGKFGVLAVPAATAGDAPIMVPTHFSLRGDEILMHLARPNSAIKLMELANEVALTIFGDYAFVNNQWRAKPDVPKEHGVPTSYYSAVNFICKPTVIHDEEGIAEVLRVQMEDLTPQGGYAPIDPAVSPFGPMMSGIRAMRLEILRVEAKFKYDDHKPIELREHVVEMLEQRGEHQDSAAAQHQRQRIAEIGEWKAQ